MRKSILKRLVAGILSVAVLSVYTPASLFVSADDNTASSGTIYDVAGDMGKTMELLAYLADVGADNGMPPIMIAEGDLVYIDDTLVSSTVPTVNRTLVENQEKIRSTYWLEPLRVGDYADLLEDDANLKAYFSESSTNYRALHSRLRSILVDLRDYFIANQLTAEDFYTIVAHMDTVAQEVDRLATDYGDSKTLYIADSSEDASDKYVGYCEPYAYSLYLAKGTAPLSLRTAEVLEKDELISAVDATGVDIRKANEWHSAVCDAAGLTEYGDILFDYIGYLQEEYSDIAASLGTLIGDVSVDSATYIDAALEDMTVDELLYAYAALYAHLYRVNLETTDSYFNLYVLIDERDHDNMHFVPVSELSTYVKDLSGDSVETVASDKVTAYKTVITQRFYDLAIANQALLDDNVCSVYAHNNTVLEQIGSMLSANYTFADLGTETVVCTEIGDVKNLGVQAETVINNIPTDLKDAWTILYDTALGIRAIDKPMNVELFKDTYARKQDTIAGKWDFNASLYDAVKYVSKVQEIDGETVSVKVPLKNDDGTEKYYARQSEETPWFDVGKVMADSTGSYWENLYTEILRNPIGISDEDGNVT